MSRQFCFARVPLDINPCVPPIPEGDFHVFISHSSEDVDVSVYLCETLEGMNFKCFHSDRDFVAGETIEQNILDGITKSKKLIAIVSKNMMKSDWVEFEIANCKKKGMEQGEVLFIPVFYDMNPDEAPTYVKEIYYLKADDEKFWEKLTAVLTEKLPLAKAIPVGNIAHGLAWSYYYGFVSLILPELANGIEEHITENHAIKKCFKYLIVVPESCKMPTKLENICKEFVPAGCVTRDHTRAGKSRSYGVPVYRIKDENSGQEYLAAVGFASTVSVLHDMENGRVSDLDSTERKRQVKLFIKKLTEIVDHPGNSACNNRATIISYKDISLGTNSLRDAVLQALQSDPV